MSHSKHHQDANFMHKVLASYVGLLQKRPILTKACTSASLGGLGCFISQMVAKAPKIDWNKIAAYATVGFVFIGPIMHHFYIFLEKAVPTTVSHPALKRMIIERLMFTPSFLLVYFYLLAMFEGNKHEVAVQRIKEMYWMALKMNWKVWTIIQYINVNYVPPLYRAPFMSLVALGWTVFISSKRK